MTNKVNFNAGGKIRLHILVAFLILLAAPIQLSAQKFNIYVFGESNDQKAKSIETILKNKIQKLLKDRYPCADIQTDDDVKTMLEFERYRQLLGAGDPDALANIASALNAPYYVSVSVMHNNGSYSLSSISGDSRRARTVAREGSFVQGDKEANDALEPMADKLVSEMIKSMPDCYQNEWIGKITYNRETRGENRSTEDAIVFDGEAKKTTEITSKATTEAEFEVRGENRPARAFVKCAEERVITIVTKGTVKCPVSMPGIPAKIKPVDVLDVDKITSRAEGRSDEARASVSVKGDEFTISVTVPEIEGGTSTGDWTLKDNGMCGDPVDKHETRSLPFTTHEEYGQADGTIDRSKPDILTGSKTIKIPSEYGIKETKIITWDLRFIRNPSAERIK